MTASKLTLFVLAIMLTTTLQLTGPSPRFLNTQTITDSGTPAGHIQLISKFSSSTEIFFTMSRQTDPSTNQSI